METTGSAPSDAAKRFGALVAQAVAANPKLEIDLTPGAGGRAKLAELTGMSRSSVSRMLEGRTLPLPHQFEAIAKVIGADVRDLLITSGVISEEAWPLTATTDVRSVPTHPEQLSPEAVADSLGITDPTIRAMLLAGIRQAIDLQHTRGPDRASAGGP